jgi:predicted CXXCH cytochrome family protein
MNDKISSRPARLPGSPTILGISLASLIAAPALAGALLLLAAIPVLADGGPHQTVVNSGTSSLTADSCAGCHRAHTAQGEFLLAAQNEEALCFSCHGNGGTGATTDVEWGIQYRPTSSNARPTVTFTITGVSGGVISTSGPHGFIVGQTVAIRALTGVTNGDYTVATTPLTNTFTLAGQTPTNATYPPGTPTVTGSNHGAVLGALRNGGFVRAAIDSGNAARQLVGNDLSKSDDHFAKVSVRVDGTGAIDSAPVTSAHLNLTSNGLTAPTVAWGNDVIGLGDKGPGPVVNLACSSCHNPHGNGLYRILNPVPEAEGAGFVTAPARVEITDSPVDNPDPAESDTKNYTVIQVRATTPSNLGQYLLYADDVLDAGYGPATGDYWHVRVPWSVASTTTNGSDAPNGIPFNRAPGLIGFNTQMTAWCTSCHTRYYESIGDSATGDLLYAYRHETTGNRACTTCHVAHGSNARMGETFSATQPFPNGDVPAYSINGATGDSRLLKVDGRGTCQLCHDPTYTAFPVKPYTGPVPSPGIP